ncbi:MAG: hypothetical protein Q7U36_02515 [bacterium]|nr:hypothetical protein [bacterium]
MKMDIKIDLKDFRKFLNFSAMRRNTESFFFKRAQFFLLLILFFSAVYLVFIWYVYIFHSQWNETRVKEYMEAKQSKSEAVFNRDNFQKVIDESNARSIEFEKPLEDVEDIFRLNK